MNDLAFLGVQPNYSEEEERRFGGHLVGLYDSSHGRSCSIHSCCGQSLQPGDLVRFRLTVLSDSAGGVREAIRAVKIVDGIEGCCVGFLPRRLTLHHKHSYEGKFAQILEIYSK